VRASIAWRTPVRSESLVQASLVPANTLRHRRQEARKGREVIEGAASTVLVVRSELLPAAAPTHPRVTRGWEKVGEGSGEGVSEGVRRWKKPGNKGITPGEGPPARER